VARSRTIHDLTLDELRDLMIEKKRAERLARLEEFAKTGKITLQPAPNPGANGKAIRSVKSVSVEGRIDRSDKIEPKQRSWVDRLLVVIEVLAVVGLLLLILYGVVLLRNLNKEASDALAPDALTPTPLISAIVLPSGHTPPQPNGGGEPNMEEIPAHLRPLVTAMPELPIPTSSPQQAIRIQIPAIGVDNSVIQGDGWEQLMRGVGQHIGTPNPGEKGNIVLSAHNDIFGEIFRDLDKLQPGDQVILFTSQRSYTYIVQQTQIVEPTRVDLMMPTREPIVTLISCYPYMVDNQRIVVTALLQD